MFTPHIVLCAIQGVAPRLAIDPWGADNIFVAHLCTCVHLFSSFLFYICIYICHPHYMSNKYMNYKKGSGLLHLSNVHQWVNDWSLNGDGTGHWWRVNYLYSICLRRGGSHPIRMLLMKLGDGRTQSFADHHSQQTTECWRERHW